MVYSYVSYALLLYNKTLNNWNSVSILILIKKIFELLALILQSENRQFKVCENKSMRVHAFWVWTIRTYYRQGAWRYLRLK